MRLITSTLFGRTAMRLSLEFYKATAILASITLPSLLMTWFVLAPTLPMTSLTVSFATSSPWLVTCTMFFKTAWPTAFPAKWHTQSSPKHKALMTRKSKLAFGQELNSLLIPCKPQ
eukprot:09892_2